MGPGQLGPAAKLFAAIGPDRFSQASAAGKLLQNSHQLVSAQYPLRHDGYPRRSCTLTAHRLIGLLLGRNQYRTATQYQERSEVTVAILCDPPQVVLATRAVCPGTRPIQAQNWRPLVKSCPLPIVAAMALAVVGPIPGSCISCLACSSSRARCAMCLSYS